MKNYKTTEISLNTDYLLETEKVIKVIEPNELYYVQLVPDSLGYLNISLQTNRYFISSIIPSSYIRTIFTGFELDMFIPSEYYPFIHHISESKESDKLKRLFTKYAHEERSL